MKSFLLFQKEPIFVSSVKDFEDNFEKIYNNNQMFYSTCQVCHCNYVYKNRNSLRVRRQFICKYCQSKLSFEKRQAGNKRFIENLTDEQKKEFYKARNEKSNQTKLEQYGRINVGCFGSIEHNKALIEKYGSLENARNVQIEHSQATCLQKYDTKTPNQFGSDKFKEIILEKYGYENAFQVPEFKEKLQNTQRQKHGGVLAVQDEDVKQKIKQTCIESNAYSRATKTRQKTYMEKFGVINNSQLPDYHIKKMRKYHFNGLTFDSSWELAFYIFYYDKNIKLKQSDVYFEYDFNNQMHRYFPDFIMPCGVFVEIKGDQFKDTDGKLKNVYNPKDLKYKAKFDCAVKHNVVILYYKDIKIYLDYMLQKYGSSWKKLFRAS